MFLFSFCRNQPIEKQRTYLVYEDNLMELFSKCQLCNSLTAGKIAFVSGTMVKVVQECNVCTESRVWFSQPYIGGKPAGNLLVSASILFAGSIPSKALRIFSFMNMASVSMGTFMNYQKAYLHPSIKHVWDCHQTDYIQDVVSSEFPVILGGDGRADTPGHSAKYGSYSVMDLEEGVVIDVQLVQVIMLLLQKSKGFIIYPS